MAPHITMPSSPDSLLHADITAAFATPTLRQASSAVVEGNLALAERIVREWLRHRPADLAATIILADIAARVGIYREAERLLRSVLTQAPNYADAAVNLALAVFPQGRVEEAIVLLDTVLSADVRNVRAAATKADLLAQTGEYAAAETTYRALLTQVGSRGDIWMWYGHLLKTMGRRDDAVAAYRTATALDMDLAEAWWSLAELKTQRLTIDDVAAIEAALARAVSGEKRMFLEFALAKTLEDTQAWDASFTHYKTANALRIAREPHDRAAVSAEVDRTIGLYTSEFLGERGDWGCPAPDPIFIIGMPRAGSTLLEQILSSHSSIEATAELPDIPLIAQALVAERWEDKGAAYPDVVAGVDRSRATDLGQRYIEATQRHRKTAAPFFIDKLPNNWRHVGLIRLILPNARIIDARRSAMACCFSNFKQHYAQGQTFAYDLVDLGSYYRDYTRAMLHFDRVLPDWIYRFDHETLLADPEPAIRRLLSFMDLPFEPACLAPHENRRPVRTASSEQVRRPINRDAVDQWRHFEPWLGPLRTALGDAA